jgi:sigma-E factor negative regulatory protein RseA
MSEHDLKEKLSLLMDEESTVTDGLKTLKMVAGDPAAQEQWRRYSLIRESLRSHRVLVPDRDFASRISAALADEPTVLAPRPAKAKPWVSERFVTSALAASLAMVAVLVGKSMQEYSPIRGADLLKLSSLISPSVQASVDPEFQDYLVSHYETAYLSGAQGMMPSVRVVSADAGL